MLIPLPLLSQYQRLVDAGIKRGQLGPAYFIRAAVVPLLMIAHEGVRKDSLLFLDLRYKLVTEAYWSARRVHLILDKYGIDDSHRRATCDVGGYELG